MSFNMCMRSEEKSDGHMTMVFTSNTMLYGHFVTLLEGLGLHSHKHKNIKVIVNAPGN